jgi:GxxExxY protein
MDLLVEDSLVVELKSVEQLMAVHKAQLLTYIKLAKKEVGLLLNFNTAHLRQQGIIRVVNSLPPSRPSR